MEKPNIHDLSARLQRATEKSVFHERDACCWQGYLAALLEWDLISPNDHQLLSQLVPVSDPNPATAIFLEY